MTSKIEITDATLKAFMENQGQFNDRLSQAVDKLTDTVSQIHVQQAEINQLNQNHANFRNEYERNKERVGERLGKLESQTEITKEFRDDLRSNKRILIGAVVSIVAGLFIWLVKGG